MDDVTCWSAVILTVSIGLSALVLLAEKVYEAGKKSERGKEEEKDRERLRKYTFAIYTAFLRQGRGNTTSTATSYLEDSHELALIVLEYEKENIK